MILTELKRSREALNNAIAYIEAETGTGLPPVRSRVIRLGEGRAVAILACMRDAGGRMKQREFEDTCLRNSRTLVGAGGFIARGSIVRAVAESGDVEYEITEKGIETVTRWEARYGKGWINSLESPDVLGNSDVHDHQKIRMITNA